MARALVNDVQAITRGQHMAWVSVHELALRHAREPEGAVEAAVGLAIEKGWMTGSPHDPPISVCLKAKGGFGT